MKSPQQVLARIVKERMPKAFVLTVMPCYDKKLEAIRFEIEEGVKEVDITITTTELLELYNKLEGEELSKGELKTEGFKIDRLIYQEVPFGFVQDVAANGHIKSLLGRLGAKITK